MDEVKVSIIVPVYNIPENVLRHCIESTINQTLKEIEIILVDDGSTNNSGMICDEYKDLDMRIKVVHKRNEGLSAARNTGYKMASGEWVTFLDSDDWIDPHTCEDTYKMGMSNKCDVVIFGTVQEFEKYKNPFKYHYNDGTVFEGEKCKELQCEILNFAGNIATAWAKLFNKKFLDENKLQHNAELRQGSEGIEFNIRVFEKVRKVYFSNHVYYHYIFNPNSISAKHDEKNHYFVIRCFEEIKRQIENSVNKKNLEKLFYNRFAVVIVAAISGYFSPANKVKYRAQKKGYIKYLNNNLVKETLANVSISQIDFQRRIAIMLIKLRCFIGLKFLSYIRFWQKNK